MPKYSATANMTTTQPKINFKKLVADLMFTREHPFYDDWKDWQEIVYNYHNPMTVLIQRKINKGSTRYNDDLDLPISASNLADEVFFGRLAHLSQRYRTHDVTTFWADRFDDVKVRVDRLLGDCSCATTGNVDDNCIYYLEHMRGHLIGVMWAYCVDSRPCKKWKKYYTRLERVILSLPKSRLGFITLEMIQNPDKFSGRGRHLLKEMYRRAFLDGVNPHIFAEKIEELKHFLPREQGGATKQSTSDAIFPDELIPTAQRVFEKYSMEDLFKWTRVRQQSIFSIDVNHKFEDRDLDKLKNLIQNSQDSFTTNLEATMTNMASKITVIFVTAGTVALLTKIATGIASDIIYKLLHLIYSLVFRNDSSSIEESYRVIKQQSGDLKGISIPFLPTMILNHVISAPSSILKLLWRNRNIDLIMKRLGYFGDPKIDQGLERVIVWIKRLFNRTMNWYSREVLGISVPEDLDSDSHAISRWNEEVDEIVKSYFAGDFVWSETSWSVVYNLYSRGLTFTRSKEYKKQHYDVWRMVNKLGNLLEKFKSHQISGQTIRNPPVTIFMTGDTGVGKSTITYPMSFKILQGIFQKEQSGIDLARTWKSMVYTRNAEQEFWDGYENQLVTVFDDFNQISDSPANPSLELFEIIRASNVFPYPLHMAALDQKANTCFTSKIVLVSSNMERPKTASLNYPSALQRRFDVAIRVSRKAGKTGHLPKFDPDAYVFEEYDMQTSSTLQTLTFDELIKKCVDQYFSRREFVDSIEQYIADQCESSTSQTLPAQQGGLDLAGLVDEGEPSAGLDPAYRFPDARQIAEWDPLCQAGVRRAQTRPPILSRVYAAAVNSIFTRHSEPKSPTVEDQLKEYRRRHTVDQERMWWCDLRQITSRVRSKCVQLHEAWIQFKVRHPYWSNALKVVGWLFAGLMFLKAFTQVAGLFKSKKAIRPMMTECDFLRDFGPRQNHTRSEAYSPVAIPKSVKVEGYNNPAVKTAKVESYTPVAQPRAAKVESVAFDPKTGLPEAQGVKDLNATEILLTVARRNLYKMYETSTGIPIGHVFFLRGKICVMPKHFVAGLQQALRINPDSTVYFKSVLLNRAFECRIGELLETRVDYQSPDESRGPVFTRDLTTMVCNTSIVHPDAIPYFCSRGSLSHVDATAVVIPVMVENNIRGSDRDIVMLRFKRGRSCLQREEILKVGDDDEQEIRWIRDAWRYEADTQPTECGAPVIVRNTLINPGKICGFHVAGLEGTGEGWATPFYQEDAVAIISMFPEEKGFVQRQRTILGDFPKEQGQVPKEAEFIRLGTIQKPVVQPRQSAIRPSESFGRIRDPISKPCALTPVQIDGQTFDPRAYRLGRLGNVPQTIPRDIIENSKAALVDEISSVVVASKDVETANLKAVYTFEEAIMGIDGEPYINSIKRTTSPGYPFIQTQGYTQRKNFFGADVDYDLSSPQCAELRKRVHAIIDSAKKGEILDHYFIDTLKDERKPKHKAHKTRLFSAGPLDYLIACKMYFNGVVALLQKSRNLCHVSVGTNPYSEDWGEIVKSLLRKSDKMVAGDFEGFDASQHQSLLEACGEVFVELSKRHLNSSDEDCKVMRALLVSLFYSLHITGSEVYQWTHSLPSGHYLTAPINSIFVNLAFGCIWQHAFKDVSYRSARSFWNKCGIVAYGDDHIISIPPSYLDVFNQYSIPEYFKTIGLSYTMEDKDADVTRPCRDIFEISYLKRSFRRDEETGRWLAPLSLDVILETPMWMHKCPDPVRQTCENLDWALKELSLHDHRTWYTWAPVIHGEQVRLGFFTEWKHQADTRLEVLSQNLEM